MFFHVIWFKNILLVLHVQTSLQHCSSSEEKYIVVIIVLAVEMEEKGPAGKY